MRLTILFSLFSLLLSAQSKSPLLGGWESTFKDADGRQSELTMTIADGYMVMTAYNEVDGDFIATLGGSWRADPNNFNITYEFDSSDSTKVGSVTSISYILNGNTLIFNEDKVWTRTDDNSPGALAGAWEITARKRNGTIQDLSSRRTSPRKTMKILSGTRFQWIAYNTDTKRLLATGGGRYTTDEQGLYIEKIAFFSRDPSRVGSQLSFDYQLSNGDWLHRGLSSNGKPIHEVWSRR